MKEVPMAAWFSRRQLLSALLAALGGWLGRRRRPRPSPASPARSRWHLPSLRSQLAAGPAAAGRLTEHYYDRRGRLVASKPGAPRTADTTPHWPISYTPDTAPHRPISYTTSDTPGAAIEPQPDDAERRPGTVAS
jgi:hypothetical protein